MTDTVTGLPVVGMVGAGQLARMTHQAAIALGLSLRVLAESPTDGAALVTPAVEIGRADDWEALTKFAAGCDAVTFDHEHVPNEFVAWLAAAGVAVWPRAESLRFAQDKRAMRQCLEAMGIAVPKWSDDPQALPRPYIARGGLRWLRRQGRLAASGR